MKLIMIRHGMTEANEKHLYCGSTDIPLSVPGAEALKERKSSVSYPDAEGYRVVTSGMKRCDETLSVLYGDMPHEVDPDLREMDFGVFEMRSYDEMKDDPVYIDWISGDNEANIAPGGESGNIMTERVIRAVRRLIDDGRDALVVTHGGVIAAVMSYLFPEERKNRYEWQPKPGGGYLIDPGARNYVKF